MANFDLTCIKIFQAVDLGIIDTTATYAMIDATLLAEALAGLTALQQTTINSYIYVPLTTDYALRGFPTWAGNSPSPIYFKVTGTTLQQATALQSALAKRYK